MDKKQRYRIIIIITGALSILAVLYFSPMQYLIQGYGNLDSDSKHLVSILVVSGLGLTLFAIRHFDIDEYLLERLEAWDLAVMIIVPSADIFAYFMKNPDNWYLALLAYFIGIFIWFLLVIGRHKITKDVRQEKILTFSIAQPLLVFVAYGILACWEIVTLLSLKHVG